MEQQVPSQYKHSHVNVGTLRLLIVDKGTRSTCPVLLVTLLTFPDESSPVRFEK